MPESESIGSVDENCVDRRDIDTGLDDHCTDETVVLPFKEVEHDFLELARRHLAVSHRKPNVGQQLLEILRKPVNGLDTVVDEIDLSRALNLPSDRIDNATLVEGKDLRVDGEAILRRCVDDGHVARAHERHVQGTRNRRRCEGDHVDEVLELLDFLFVTDSETLLLVDDE